MGCGCGGSRRASSGQQWEVVDASGMVVDTKHSKLGAEIAAQAIQGATVRQKNG